MLTDRLVDRMIKAAMLDVKTYEEVEHDQEATTQALTVVLIAAVASGIGTALGGIFSPLGIGFSIGALIFGVIFALIGWVVWSVVVYFVGTSLFAGKATIGEVLRTVGFAESPGVVAIISFIPVLGGLISFAVSIWTLVAMVVAVRQALDFTTGKAIVTALVGWVIMLVVTVILAGAVGVAALGGLAMMGR